jgi:hypothetical protein
VESSLWNPPLLFKTLQLEKSAENPSGVRFGFDFLGAATKIHPCQFDERRAFGVNGLQG